VENFDFHGKESFGKPGLAFTFRKCKRQRGLERISTENESDHPSTDKFGMNHIETSLMYFWKYLLGNWNIFVLHFVLTCE